MTTWETEVDSVVETDRLAAALSSVLPARLTIGLTGTLGAGKTRFVQGLAATWNIPPETVVSPTFVLCQEYRGTRTVYHLDLYRLHDEDEFIELGPEEMFDAAAITVIEWSERFTRCLPEDRLDIRIEIVDVDSRRFVFDPRGPRASEVVTALQSEVKKWSPKP